MISVLIVARSQIVRLGIEEFLRGPGLEIVASVPALADLDDPNEDSFASAVIVTSADPSQAGVVVAEATASEAFHATPIVALSDPDDAGSSASALVRLGLRSILSGDFSRLQILAALQAVSFGLVVTTPDSVALPAGSSAGTAPEMVEPLTPRELEVLRLLASGLANKQIADRLGISDNTVKFHVAAILGKLGAASRTEAVAIGIREGLILL